MGGGGGGEGKKDQTSNCNDKFRRQRATIESDTKKPDNRFD